MDTCLVHPGSVVLVVCLYLVAVTLVSAMTEALLEVAEEFQNLVLSQGFLHHILAVNFHAHPKRFECCDFWVSSMRHSSR